MLVVKMICKECYVKQYGDLPVWEYGKLYEMTKEEKRCEKCGKTNFLVYTLEKYEGEPWKIEDLLK